MSDDLGRGFFIGTVHMITDAGSGPVYALGSIDVVEEKAKAGVLRALMLVKASDQATWLVSRRGLISLQEILNILPPEMVQYGTIAGIQLKGEAVPTSIVIYSGIQIEDLRQLTYARLYTSQANREEVQDFLRDCREKSNIEREMLQDPIPVVELTRFSDQNQNGKPNPEETV